MATERWQQVKEIFYSAIELPPERRVAFLSKACDGKKSLRSEVESLISAHEESNHFIDVPAFQASAEMLEDDAELKPGETLGRYQICSALGEGGMGKVYLGLDTKLNRKVALKVLPAASRSDDDARTRLLREAQAAAALDHPNICAIYEVDDSGERGYIAMQYLEGETLEARIVRGRLATHDALNIALQIVNALCEAHAHNIIHRDIKPANIIIDSRGQVKVLDFGLAKSTDVKAEEGDRAERQRNLTTPGTIVGTVPYMSPEQLRGETAGPHSDLFSLGVVMYEMFCGQPAFQRGSDAETIGAILHEQPPELSSVEPSMPEAVEAVVRKCLAKEISERYQTARQVADDLSAAKKGESVTIQRRTIRTAKTSIASFRKRGVILASAAAIILAAAFGYYIYSAREVEAIDSIAVLPFANVSNDENTEYLSEGISDSIINSLQQVPNIKRVISLTSALRYKGQQIDPQTVGRELKVQAVLTGKLTLRGDDLLISAELVDVKDNKRLWGGQYNRKLADVVRLQGEIAQEIAGGLRLKLTGNQKERLSRHHSDSPDAYRAYLMGRYFMERLTPQSTAKGIEYLKEAIRLDPNYGLAYATLANLYLRTQNGQDEAKQAAARALEIDDTLAEAHAVLGNIRLIEGNWSGSEKAFIRARELNPHYKRFHLDYAHYLRLMKRFEESVAESKRVLENDPLSVLYNRQLAVALYFARRYDEAIEQCLKTLELEPGMPTAYFWLAKSYEQKGLYDQAVEAWLKTGQFSNHGPEAEAALREAYAESGWMGFWRKALELRKTRTKAENSDHYSIARDYARLGERDRAFASLEKGYEQHDLYVLIWLNCDPFWDNLRSDPRYANLVRRMNLEP
jgi:serine/threonine protein kinase/tetratricopeptide (TPR) repeat protein